MWWTILKPRGCSGTLDSPLSLLDQRAPSTPPYSLLVDFQGTDSLCPSDVARLLVPFSHVLWNASAQSVSLLSLFRLSFFMFCEKVPQSNIPVRLSHVRRNACNGRIEIISFAEILFIDILGTSLLSMIRCLLFLDQT